MSMWNCGSTLPDGTPLIHSSASCHLEAEATPAKMPMIAGMPHIANLRSGSITCWYRSSWALSLA